MIQKRFGNLSRADIEWDFCYEYDGKKGLWIEVK